MVCCDLRNSGLRISLRNYKVSNGKQNVTAGKRSPILNSCQPAVPGRFRDISRALRRAASHWCAVAARGWSRIVHLPNTANYQKPRRLTRAQEIFRMLFDDKGKWLFSRLMGDLRARHAANAFAVWEFSQFSGGEMKVTQLYCVRHLPTVTCSLVGVALLAIGANAALDLHASEAAKVVSAPERTGALQLALIIGNGNYPDAAEPLNQPINDASGLAYAMRRHGFDVDVVEDATKADMARAVERLKSRIIHGSVVMLFF